MKTKDALGEVTIEDINLSNTMEAGCSNVKVWREHVVVNFWQESGPLMQSIFVPTNCTCYQILETEAKEKGIIT